MKDDENQAAASPLLRFHYHSGDGGRVHTQEVSITVKRNAVVFVGYVHDPSSMVYGDGQTNEYDWATVEMSTDAFIDGLTRVQLGEVWKQQEMSFEQTSLSMGTRAHYSPGPACATLSEARRALLFLDAHDAAFSTLEQARTGTRLPARQFDKLFLESVRKHPQHVARMGTVGLERTVHALLQEAHLSEISVRPLAEGNGLWLVTAAGDERERMLLAVQPGASETLGLHVVDRINGVRDRNMITKAVIVTRSSFTHDVLHSYAGYQDRIELVDYDRLMGTLVDAGWTSHVPGFLTLPVANRPRRSVFISFSYANRDFAVWLYNRLHGWGFHCFLDDVDLRAGEVILSALQAAISGVDAVVLCCSQKALESLWVRAEIEYATSREKAEGNTIIIPLDMDGALARIDTIKGVPDYMLALRSRLGINFQGWTAIKPYDTELEKLRRSIEQL
jgi:TIR domain/Restriction endonuclease